MKTIEEALILRNTLLSNFEKATICTNPKEKQALMNIVIVRGGATGVEISGVLAEMNFVLPKDYPDLKQSEMNIFLVESSPHLLAAMSEEASVHAKSFLEGMGVKVILQKKVIDYKEGKVILDDGNSIETKTVVWVSGVTATRFEQIENKELGRGGRILVNEYNQLPGSQNVFAIGDVCLQTETNYPNGHPQVAQVAIQQGILLADNLKRLEKGETLKPFHYKNLGNPGNCRPQQSGSRSPQNKTARFLRLASVDGCTSAFHLRSKEQDHGPDRMGVELLHLRPVHTINPVHPEEETEQTGRITLGNLQVIRQRHPSHLSVTIADLGHLQVFRINDRCFFETT